MTTTEDHQQEAPPLDPAKLREAYHKADRLFGARTEAETGTTVLPPAAPAALPAPAIQPVPAPSAEVSYLQPCLLAFAAVLFVLVLVYLDDIYLLIHRS